MSNEVERGSGRPLNSIGYRTDKGKRVPSVTEILKGYKDPGGLMHWAWKMGMDGKDYRKAGRNAAAAGTICHNAIEAHIKEKKYSAPEGVAEEVLTKARKGFAAFKRWYSTCGIEMIATEVPLISAKYEFGGTPDAIGRFGDGTLVVLDWKTSKAVYADMLYQMAAYALLWEENRDGRIAELHLLRVGKEYGNFTHHHWGLEVLGMAIAGFLGRRDLHRIDEQLKGAV